MAFADIRLLNDKHESFSSTIIWMSFNLCSTHAIGKTHHSHPVMEKNDDMPTNVQTFYSCTEIDLSEVMNNCQQIVI